MPSARLERRRSRLVPLTLALALAQAGLAGCATTHAEVVGKYYSKALDEYRYPQSCTELWPSALQLLASQGYPLIGTNQLSPGGSGRIAYETDWNEKGGKYRVVGTSGKPGGCWMTFTFIWADSSSLADWREVNDWGMQLAFLKTIDPAAAEQIEAGAPKR